MGIPGEDLPGSVSATELVAWYCGHPDSAVDRFRLDARSVAVVGAGNVAGDVARMLARSPEELRPTDTPDHVLAAFAGSAVEDVHLLSRRGPVQARFTTRELRELADLELADVVVDPEELALDPVSEATLPTAPAARRNLEVLRSWAGQPLTGKPRRVHLRFWWRPVELTGEDAVTGIRLERTRLDEAGALHGTGDLLHLPVQLVVRAVGYRSLPLPGLPFDEAAGVVPHEAGRVRTPDGPMRGMYVAGWAKRGPTGVIGTNKHDARETVRALLADLPSLVPAPVRDPQALLDLLAQREVDVVTWEGWAAIDRAETERGRAQGRTRAKISDRRELLRLASSRGSEG
jgi:ferredoxin--NADP+ reductase